MRIGFVAGAVVAVLSAAICEAKTVRYELAIEPMRVNLSGKGAVDFALAVNGSIPAPTLEFTEGDIAEIVLTNKVPGQEASVHWHGILLPSEMDGVPFVNTPPIGTGQSYTFRFKVRQHGTYWYHSHSGTQEQKGVYGAIVIHPAESRAVARDVVAVLSDWTDENPDQVLRNLRKDGDYYQYKKNTVRSWWDALKASGLGEYFKNQWSRMPGMDLSDVGYDAFLINGKKEMQLADVKPGEKVRLRLINAASSTYFRVSLAGLPMTVVAADGSDVTPISTNEILMGMAETYDVEFTASEHKNYELRATAQDGTGFASAWIGEGEDRVRAPTIPRPDLYAPMDHGAHGMGAPMHDMHGAHHGHDMSGAGPISRLTVDDLRAPAPTSFAHVRQTHDVKLVLGGDMQRYIWYINGKAIHQERVIEINPGDIVKFTLVNDTMMHHPIHLHGHFFRVLNDGGDRSPLKHTVDVPPFGTRVIEFSATEPGQWMLHCHNLYHMMGGMARVVKYSSFTPPVTDREDPHRHDHIFSSGRAEIASQHAQGRLRLSKTWDTLDAKIESREEAGGRWQWEGDVLYRRWLGNYLSLTAGAVNFDSETRAAGGVTAILPMMIETTLLLDHEGDTRLEVEKRFQWTRNVFSDVDFTFRQHRSTEFEVSLMYGPSWSWAAGLMVTEEKLGAGVEYRF